MKNKELIEYLRGFDPESEVYIGAVNVTERKKISHRNGCADRRTDSCDFLKCNRRGWL